ncbi:MULTISPECIES: alpha-E domain-containing protein [unclassified Adlercreutzia]|uniref:alpha-E domain-containing protein n=1 Tax=unclassified Adlercreutzia TaxID=2636013 RepID=UPI0013EB025F|nr:MULTISPECIES: alpha-E domain-containing protein [unclassified Adlercreutzia]
MGSLSIEKVEHLLWLGRYVERSYTTLRFILSTYDAALDSLEGNWKGQLEELGFDASNDDPLSFFNNCLFDLSNASSLKYSMNAAYDNAVLLRDVIGTESIAYVQMAADAVDAAEVSDAPLLDLQLVLDYIMAFKGCVDDYIADDSARNIIKSGISVERLDLYTRLSFRLDRLPKETHRLAGRIDRIGIPYNKDAFKRVIACVFDQGFPENMTYERLGDLLADIAGIF